MKILTLHLLLRPTVTYKLQLSYTTLTEQQIDTETDDNLTCAVYHMLQLLQKYNTLLQWLQNTLLYITNILHRIKEDSAVLFMLVLLILLLIVTYMYIIIRPTYDNK